MTSPRPRRGRSTGRQAHRVRASGGNHERDAVGSETERGVDLAGVLWAKLGPEAGTGNPSRRTEALRILRGYRTRQHEAVQLDSEVLAAFGLVATDPSDVDALVPEITAFLQQGWTEGMGQDPVPATLQAYVRAVGRIVAAESDVAAHLLRAAAPEERERVLDSTLDGLLPLASRGFDLLHRMMLLEALLETLAGLDRQGPDNESMAIAMVDMVGSTSYLMTSRPGELERMVDALFEAGQRATAHRRPYVVKHVGDGLFVTGRAVAEVADVALDIIDHLEAALPLRARGGLAWGPVVQRSGDLFGLPINVAHIATKSARPGMLLATAEAAALLPASRRGRYRAASLAHPALGSPRVATVRRAH